MMPANIIHPDLFEVEICHEKQPLIIYDNAQVTHDAKGDHFEPTEHVGALFGLTNKVVVLPAVLPKSNRTMHMKFNLMPGFDFRSGNAVLVGLRVGQVIRASALILKEVHETKQPDSSSGFHWGRTQLAEGSQGTMVITVTRGLKVRKAKFVPLVGEDGKPYSIEIEWRVLKARLDGAGDPESRRPNALHNTTARFERTATPTQPKIKHTATKLVTPTKQGESAKPAIALTAAKSYPSDDDENKVPRTPSTRSETPNHSPDATVHANSPDVSPTATPTPESKEIKPSTSKRNAAEAFGPKQANGDDSIKQLQLRLRKAKAELGVTTARFEHVASKVGQDDIGCLQILHGKAEAVYRVAEVMLQIKAAELGDQKDSEYFELQLRESEIHLKVVEAEEMLLGKTESEQ